MYIRDHHRPLVTFLLAATLTACASSATVQRQESGISPEGERVAIARADSGLHYDVTFDSSTAAARSLRLRVSFSPDPNGSGPVILSFPRWTPGAYELGEYAQFVTDFRAEAGGTPLRWQRSGPESWSIWPDSPGEVTVSYTYIADSLDNAFSWSQPDFAFFNGTNLFPYPAGQPLDRLPASLTIRTEADWKVATGMTPADGPRSYRESSYHDFVDMPVFIGRFDLDSIRVAERWTYLATYPSGTLSGAARAEFWRQKMQSIPPMARVFGEVPYRDYWSLIAFVPGTGSALEHQNSHLGLYDPGFMGSVLLPSITAHEIFHVWNVKRLRPQAMVPYRYDRRQPTRLLWVSEGITDYYADLALVRGGVVDTAGFLALLDDKLREVENAPAASLHDVAVGTWTGAADGTRYLYYAKGGLVGLLLDIVIRDASDGAGSLDDVMRSLYERRYRSASGFTDEDFWTAVADAAGRDLSDFRARWVAGREPLPLDEVLPLAALRVRTDSSRIPLLGVTLDPHPMGLRVSALAFGGVADRAGIRPGDVIRSVGDVRAREVQPFIAEYQARYAGADGEVVPVVLLRGGVERQVEARLETSLVVSRGLDLLPDAPEKARRILAGLLSGSSP